MGTDIMTTGAGGFSAAADRRDNRALVRHVHGLEREKVAVVAKIEQQAQLQALRAEAVGYVGQQAMQSVAMLSQIEGQLGMAVPLAVTRLEGIADMTAMSIAQVVVDSVKKLG